MPRKATRKGSGKRKHLSPEGFVVGWPQGTNGRSPLLGGGRKRGGRVESASAGLRRCPRDGGMEGRRAGYVREADDAADLAAVKLLKDEREPGVGIVLEFDNHDDRGQGMNERTIRPRENEPAISAGARG
ncbi:LacI family transcriptional regulator protein [Anopheles sinensis]|uniref:LacI family transcriptional regulator protein n=1 Tax=Anopheles sinensis TaxID=74873 RepID=A0A084VBS9_ANOSI|nr:LacI family transcriptional regulator protein [Anopheles sinensis]